jgi:hypothetical protein
MGDEPSQRERALRRLPLPYSLALRLRDAGVSADVICQYVNVEQAALMVCTAWPKRNFVRRKTQQMIASTGAGEAAERITLRSRGRRRPSFQPRTTLGHCRLGMRQAANSRWRLSSTAPRPGEIAAVCY